MYYTVYRITNIINNKTYVGKHKTNNLDDGYMGSGKILKRALEKHGLDKFRKEILFVFDNEQAMNAKEKELVVLGENSYNLCPGGQGGFGHINANTEFRYEKNRRAALTTNEKYADMRFEWCSRAGKTTFERHGLNKSWFDAGRTSFLGRKHSEETKKIISQKNSIHQMGANNSQFGSCWITDGSSNKKIKKEELDYWLALGYNRGRKMK